MMGRGDVFACLCALLAIIELVVICTLAVLSIVFPPEMAGACEFRLKPKDRPVLESVQQVWKARTTGVCEFNIGGVHYVVVNMPKEYVDYSSWYCRMP